MHRPRTTAGREGLHALLADPAGSLVALDYDGTLAPVVARPEEAVPEAGALDALVALAGTVGQLALITGRPCDVVVQLAGVDVVPGLVVLGQYGVERWEAGVVQGELPLAGVASARARLPGLIDEAGVQVEDKGRSLVVHVRQTADPEQTLERLRAPLASLAAEVGLELHLGRLVLELRPPGFDKGRALTELALRRSAVLFAGDDRGDLAAFDAADRLRAQGTPALLVCSDSAETPPELRARADLVVAGPPGVVELLTELVEALSALTPPGADRRKRQERPPERGPATGGRW